MSEHTQFVPFSAFIEPGFWSELTRLKLHEYRLDDSPKPLRSYFGNSDLPGVPCRLSFGFGALNADQNIPSNSTPVSGSLLLTNTIEDFKSLNRNEILDAEGKRIWESIQSGDCLRDPSLLNRCLVTCYADLKKYHYFYWFAYPAFCFPDNVQFTTPPLLLSQCHETFSSELVSELPQIISKYFQDLNYDRVPSVFLLLLRENKCAPLTLDKLKESELDDFNQTYLVVSDPSTNEEFPGWPVRNAVAALAFHRPNIASLSIICWKQRFHDGRINCGHSLFLQVNFTGTNTVTPIPKVVGWEKNERGRLGPRFVDMSSSLDPVRLAENAVNLNLQLMRWRLLPELNLSKMQALKCLLVGAGTLGCNVARCLLAWGVHHITFVDNANVSYSNPVRQSLFRFKDSLNGGRPKAKVAAESLLEIVPSATVEGHQMTIPMPGHVISANEEEEVKAVVDKITKMVQAHDVVFLLLDSREGRWLPTLLATLYSKIAFSVALGFDSYVVIRHGWRQNPTETLQLAESSSGVSAAVETTLRGDQLGCYFCCDVTAPGNSAKDRSLDQQCTVTRPGVSVMAAALAVETLSSLIQHPLRGLAPASTSLPENSGLFDDHPEDESCLGSVPHQIRGYVSRFQQITPCVQRFKSCVACSETIMNEHMHRNWEFLRDVFNSPKSLEKITGLDELQSATDQMEVWELSDTESVKSME